MFERLRGGTSTRLNQEIALERTIRRRGDALFYLPRYHRVSREERLCRVRTSWFPAQSQGIQWYAYASPGTASSINRMATTMDKVDWVSLPLQSSSSTVSPSGTPRFWRQIVSSMMRRIGSTGSPRPAVKMKITAGMRYVTRRRGCVRRWLASAPLCGCLLSPRRGVDWSAWVSRTMSDKVCAPTLERRDRRFTSCGVIRSITLAFPFSNELRGR